ncbi:MAG: Cellulose synthase catalytic subunit (UDP-forming) [Syntrophorhabdus sp. PtaU1.Bin153]|nr:MAG: Cellulose synthase catalytic subunit (UDP-forming) [Syntrophorhabdus sp. PtaU1.Bin153]
MSEDGLSRKIHPNLIEIVNPSLSSRKVFTGWDYFIFLMLTVMSYGTVVWFMMHWFPCKGCFTSPIAFTGLTGILIGKIATMQYRWWQLPLMTRPVPMPTRPSWKVGVVTTFVPDAESVEMLKETVQALISLDYPHDTWVLDEGNDVHVRSFCEKLGVFHFSRKGLSQYQAKDGTFQQKSKHGNYNAWLHEIGFERYDIIVAFDPDHVPVPNFLTETIGYFNDPEIGYVQTAQAYYNQKASFIARGAAEETYWYYSAYQEYCHSVGHPIVTGCHNAHRVTALKDVGGFAAHDADDLLITLLYRSLGWKGVYVPKILARGLTPVDWNGYLKQQLRWARSVLDIKLWIYPRIAGEFSFKELFTSSMHGIHYLYKGLSAILGLLLLALMLFTGSVPASINYETLMVLPVFWLVMTILDTYHQRFFLGGRKEWGMLWRANLLMSAKWPYFLLALFQALSKHKEPYLLTKKVKEQTHAFRLFWPHLAATALLSVAWIGGIALGRSIHPVLHILAAVTVLINVFFVGTALMHFPAPYDPTICPYSGQTREVS